MVYVNEEIEQAKEKVLNELGYAPMAIVLGSGLGDFPKVLLNAKKLSYSQIPHMPQTSVQGHSGELILGELPTNDNQKRLIYCFAGRIHSYEGGPWDEVTFQVKLMASIGCKLFIMTNASGGLFDEMSGGCLCLLTGHFRLLARMDPNSLAPGARVSNGKLLETSFEKNEQISQIEDKYSHFAPDYWTSKYVNLCRSVAKEQGIKLFEGSYAWASGPSFETPLEVLMAKQLGGACVGMSTVPEMLTCNYYGMECMGISMVCNLGAGLQTEPLTHKEVLENSKIGTEHMQLLVKETLSKIDFDEATPQTTATTEYLPLRKNESTHKLTAESIAKAAEIIRVTLGEIDSVQMNVYCTLPDAPNVSELENKVDLMTLPQFPYSTASGNFGYFTKNSKNQLTLITNTHSSLDNTLTTEESTYIALVLNLLNIPNVAYFVKCSDSKVVPGVTQQEITNVTNFGYYEPLEYVETVYRTSERFVDTTSKDTKKNSYMAFMGPDLPCAMECHTAEELGHAVYGVTSLALHNSLKYLGFNVKTFVEFVGAPEKNAVQIENVATRTVKQVDIEQNHKLHYQMLKISEIEEATQFVKEQLELTDKNIESVILDLNLNLPFTQHENIKIIKSVPFKNIPHLQTEFGQTLSLATIGDKHILVVHHIDQSDESTYLRSNSLIELSFIIRVCQHLHTVNNIYLNSAVVSALNSSFEPIYAPNTLVQYRDHINFTGYNPLIGKNENRWGDRFFDVSGLYRPLKTSTKVETTNVMYANHILQLDNKELRSTVSKFNVNVLSSVGGYEALVAHHDVKPKEERVRCVSLGLVINENSEKLICPEKKKELITTLCNDILGL